MEGRKVQFYTRSSLASSVLETVIDGKEVILQVRKNATVGNDGDDDDIDDGDDDGDDKDNDDSDDDQ